MVYDGKRGSKRHALPVLNSSSVPSTLPIDEHERNISVRPLTTPLGRNATMPIQKKAAAKAKKRNAPTTIRKVGLDLMSSLGLDNSQTKSASAGGDSGLVGGRSAALARSIALVLGSRPPEVIAKEYNLKAQNRLSAAKLKEELKSMDVLEAPDSLLAIDSLMDEGEVEGSKELPVSLNWVADGNPFSATLPSPSFAIETIESMSPVADQQMVIQSSTETGDGGTSDIRSSDVLALESDATMDIDQSLPGPTIHSYSDLSELAPTPALKPIFTFPAVSTFTPYAAPASQATNSLTPQDGNLFNPYTRPGKEPSDSSEPLPKPLSKRTPRTPKLKSALPLIKDRTRNAKAQHLTTLFDYSSDVEEDWEPADAPVNARPRSGRAMKGDEPAFGSIGGKFLDPEILPAARARDRLEPTTYQKALLQSAKDENVICVMETGSGKTLIAVLLIEWMHTEIEPKRLALGGDRKKRMQFVLTNSVPLVHQQANVLSNNSSLRVGKLFGALHVNLSSEPEWAWNFENFDCLVVTAQLLLDSLAHGFIDISEISMLVFDEAHHAKSNHPFASILRDFYHRAPPESRPRILGLTASPLDSNEGISDAQRLQKLFNARLITAPEATLPALREMVSKPTVLEVKYSAPPIYPMTDLYNRVSARHNAEMSVLSQAGVLDEEEEKAKVTAFEKCSRSAEVALAEFGPDASDLVFKLALIKFETEILESGKEDMNEDQTNAEIDHALTELTSDSRVELSMETEQTSDSITDGHEEPPLKLPAWILEVKKSELTPPRLQNTSPKVQALVRLLVACAPGADEFCGIVFVNRRLDALLLTQLLRQFAKTSPGLSWLKVKFVTGHGPGNSAKTLGPKMNWGEQAAVLTAFGEGDCNLLIATSVVEEGLDVQPCNFVARFDLYTSHVSMIQSRGRCRRAGSHFILFIQDGNDAERRKLAQIRKYDLDMDKLLHDVGTAEEGDNDYGDDEAGESDEFLLESETGARLTPHFSISLLYRYAQSLPRSDAFVLNNPIFEFEEISTAGFICTVTLPVSARLRAVTSNVCVSAKIAKRQASYMCCKLLRHVGALDNHLLPIRLLSGPGEEIRDDEGRLVGSKKRQIGYKKKLSDEWTIRAPFGSTSQLYGTLLMFDGPNGQKSIRGELYRPLILLSRNPLSKTPNLKLFIDGNPLDFIAEPINSVFEVSTEERTILHAYTMRVFTTTLNRMFDVDENEVLFFVAPLQIDQSQAAGISTASLDWPSMSDAARVQEEPLDMATLGNLNDSIIVDLGKNSCRYYFQAVRENLHPGSKLPPGRQSDAGFSNVLDYYLSFNEPFFHKVHVDMNQPLLEVTRMPRIVSYLTATPRNNSSPSQKRLLERVPRFALPQLCCRNSIPASVFRTHLLLPSIVTELDQLLLAQELNAKLFSSKIDVRLLKVALTTPSACLEESYERLELLGDAFLKYLASVYCFVALDKTAHEGDLHHARLVLIQNATLFKAGLSVGLPAYLVSRPFSSRLYVPPNFQLQKGRPPPDLALIGDKTIADVCEAIMGAAYETGFSQSGLQGGFDLALEAAIAINVNVKGITSWEDVSALYGPVQNLQENIDCAIDMGALEKTLGFPFNHPHLLREALTHPSKLDASTSFQRLEWLGDSILDFLVIRYCWAKWGGSLPPGHLTELKGAMVSNETLAAVAVELELDQYLIFDNAALGKSILTYRKRIHQAKAKEIREAVAEAREVRPFWLLLDPPKAVADIVEALFGALFVDSNFGPAGPQAIFDRFLIPFYEQWVSPTKLRIDAIRILLETAQAQACDDVSHIVSTVDGSINDDGEIIIRVSKTSVIAHEVILATVVTPNAKTAKRLSSGEALVYLSQNPDFFARSCNCADRRAIAKEEAEELLERRRNEGLISDVESSESDEEGEESFNGDLLDVQMT